MTEVIEFHELANRFPLMSGKPFADLVDSIRPPGRQNEVIWTYDGKILDGRNRYRACVELGIEPYTTEFEGSLDEAKRFVIDQNNRRRHMGQVAKRAQIEAEIMDNPTRSNRAIAASVGVNDTTVGDVRARAGIPQPARSAFTIPPEALARHTREDGAVNYTGLSAELGVHRTTVMRHITGNTSHPVVEPGIRSPVSNRIRNTIAVPAERSGETAGEKARRLFLYLASGDLDLCNKIMCDLDLDSVESVDHLSELLAASKLMSAAWEKISARLSRRIQERSDAR